MDKMDKKEAIWRLKVHFFLHDDGRPTPYLDEAARMAIEALQEPKWIPIAKKLPENYKTVLVQRQMKNRFDNTINVFLHTGFLNEYGEWLHADGLGVFNGEVIAWMPLPEPYKAGEQE